jgi:hypothetical protein
VTEQERGDRTGRNATALAAGIAALGIQCALEARGGLALILPVVESVARLQDQETRRAVLALARQHGFTHVAIELPEERRDDGATKDDAPLLRD